MKKFINEHPKLYWMIVVSLAVIVFSIVTAVGCAKLERAEASASVTYKVQFGDGERSFDVPVGQYYAYLFWVDGIGWRNYMFMISEEPFDLYDYEDGTYGISSPSGGTMWKAVSKDGGNTYEYASGSYVWQNMYGIGGPSAENVYSNCDIVTRNTGGRVVYVANPIMPESVYSVDAPYSRFDNFGHDNKLVNGDAKGNALRGLYETHTSLSKWSYGGTLMNTTDDDVSYKVLMDVTVEIPNDTLIDFIAEQYDVDLGWEHEVIKYMPTMVEAWNGYTGTDYTKYQFHVELPCTVDNAGVRWGYEFPYTDTEYFLVQDDNFRVRFQPLNADDNAHWKAILMAFMHIDTVTTCIETTRADSVVYGRLNSVRFERGYEHYYTASVKADKEFVAPDAMDGYIEQELMIAQREHVKDLENRLDEMQNQIDNMQNFEGSFGTDLTGGDLWNGIKSLGSGLIGLTSFLSNIALVIGNLFVFLPYDVRQIAGYFFIATLVVALWKLIKR